jgi:hypothetical protein
MNYYYKVYNFTIKTPFPISELIEIHPQSVDISIKEEAILYDLDKVKSKGAFYNASLKYQINETDVLLNITDTGKILIKNKQTIIIDRLKDVTDEDIALYLLGTVFAYIVMLRGGFALHGSAIKIGSNCVIFTGNSGAGKSTTAARFVEKGYNLLSDDVCVISFNTEGAALVHPAYPQLKLWDNSVEKLGYDKNCLKTVSPSWAKFRMEAKSYFQDEPLILNHVFELSPSETDEIKVEKVQGFNKITLLLENTYRNFLIQSLGLERIHFQFCLQLAQQIEVKRINRPKQSFLLEELIEMIETELNENR